MGRMRLFSDRPDQRGGVIFEALPTNPAMTLECTTGPRTVEFSEAALQIKCVADAQSSQGLPLYIRMSVGFRYRGGPVTLLDYRESPGSLLLTRHSPPGQIGTDITEEKYRTYSRSIILPLADSKLMLLSPDEKLEVYLERQHDPDSYLSKMQVWVTGSLGTGIENTPWRVRQRRSELMVAHGSPPGTASSAREEKHPAEVSG